MRASTGAPSLSGGVTSSQARLSGKRDWAGGLGGGEGVFGAGGFAEGVVGDDAVVVGGVGLQFGELQGLGDWFFAGADVFAGRGGAAGACGGFCCAGFGAVLEVVGGVVA